MARTVLLPTDGSATAKAARRFAVDIAKGEGDSVIVLSVAETEAAEIRAGGIKASVEVVVDSRVDWAIVDKARTIGADLIVMGTHGRTGLARAVIGSVADRVLRHSTVPVVFVPQMATTAEESDQ